MDSDDKHQDGSDRRAWTDEEDEAIRLMVSKHGTKSWALIAENLAKEGMPGRSGKQCRERWHNHLDPNINKTPWTEEEERVMSEAHKELGNKWSEIAKRLPGRTDNHVKNHWYSFMRRNVRRLNREIGNHGSSLPVSTQVSLPLTLPTSYQPRSLEKKIINNIKTVVDQTPNGPSSAIEQAATALPPYSHYSAESPSSNSSVSEGPPLKHFSVSASKKPTSESKTNSGKKKSIRKAVNLSELQRYFHAAEEAAREIMLEEAIKAQYSTEGNSEKDGVFQLTTLSSLPLKSPKRLIALQLANNNPAFRERFRLKLEQSGGFLMGKSALNNHFNPSQQYWGNQSAFGMSSHQDLNHNDSAYSFEGELEKLINTSPSDWRPSANVSSDQNTLYNTTLNGRSFLNQSSSDQQKSANKKERGKKASKKEELTSDEGDDAVKPLKLRQKRRKELDYDPNSDLYSHELTSRIPDYSNTFNLGTNQQANNLQTTDSSIIKRRRKGELQIMVDGSLNTMVQAGPLTNAIRANNLHSLMGGGIGEMGPPGDTPRRSARLKNGSLSTISNLGNFNYLDSPGFMEKSLLFSDGNFPNFGVDTPSKLMHLDPPLSKNTAENVRFDFDEAVAAHFPSPRTGDHIKGNSPYRWSGGSTGSGVSGFFNFPDSSANNPQKQSQALANLNASLQSNAPSEPDQAGNIYTKKFKKVFKKEGARSEGTEGNDPSSSSGSNKQNEPEGIKPTNHSTGSNDISFQSPVQPSISSQPRETRTRANSKTSNRKNSYSESGNQSSPPQPSMEGNASKKSMFIDFDEEHSNDLLDTLPLDTPRILSMAFSHK